VSSIEFKKFLDLAREFLRVRGVPGTVVEWFISEALGDVKRIYEEKAIANSFEAL